MTTEIKNEIMANDNGNDCKENNGKDRVTITLRLPLREQLIEAAHEKGYNVSLYVREAVEEKLLREMVGGEMLQTFAELAKECNENDVDFNSLFRGIIGVLKNDGFVKMHYPTPNGKVIGFFYGNEPKQEASLYNQQ